MYEQYWRLDEKPFEDGWDQRFYYPSEAHQGALLKLRYAVENRRGAALAVGASGLGKSMLVHCLRRQLADSFAPIPHVVFPQMPADQLLAYLADELGAPGMPSLGSNLQQSVRRIEQALAENSQRGQHAVVVIDEAHLLTEPDTLEALRLLLNFELASAPQLTLLLVGLPSLLAVVERMPGFEQRLAAKCLLRPFSLEETVSYVSHRLTAAGATRTIFENDALEVIFELTHGAPRRINRLCDLALLIGYAEERATLAADHIAAVSQELVTVTPE